MRKKFLLSLFIPTIFLTTFSINAGHAEAEVTSMSIQSQIEVIEVVEDDYDEIEECGRRSNEVFEIDNKEEKLTQYLDLICEYRDLLEKPVLLEDYFTEEEIFLMARCVETEVYQKSFDSKVNVATVIFNRLQSEKFGNSVDEIIVDGQFAFWRTEISEDTYRAIQYAWLFGGDCEDALFFNSCSTPISFYGEYFYTDDAGHHFYR